VEKTDLESLVEACYARILRAALVMTGSRWEAEDLAQETFLQAMRSWRRFAGQSRADTWLYSILLNLDRKRLRSARRRRRRWLRWFWRERPSGAGDSPDGEVLREEWRATLWAAVAELSEPQRHAIVLRYSEGLAYDGIAEVLRCPIGTVKSRLHHGLAALQKKLAGYGPEGGPPADAPSSPRESRR
jgi:RNA polymerase sigma-70 factor (ECF subfamily)